MSTTATATATPAKNKNWLMASMRKWHIWLGIATALFLGFFFISGIVLAHKDIFQPKKVVVTSEMLAADFVPLNSDERIQLKALKEREEKEKKYLRMKRNEERAAAEASAMSAGDKAVAPEAKLANYGSEKPEKKEHGRERKEKGMGRDDDDEKEGKYKDAAWWKVMKDLHTGKFLAGNWTYFNDIIAIIGIFLAISGVYLWAVAKIRQAENARKAKAAAAAKAQPVVARPAPQNAQPAPAAGE